MIFLSRDLLVGESIPVVEFLGERVRKPASAPSLAKELDEVIAAIHRARFHGRAIAEICAMGGVTLADFTTSVVDEECLLGAWKRDVRKSMRRDVRRKRSP